MPSAEKSNSEAIKVEVAPSNEPKTSENAQKDIEHNNGEKNIPAIQQIIQILQNKVRNLEKRKNKLDGYLKEEEAGKELSSEQKKAVLKYEEVVSQLGISKEFAKQFQTIANAATKEQKRLEKKAAFLKQMQETTKVREVIIIQDLLRQLKNEAIRNDFLNAQNGACLIEAIEMDVLELFAKHTVPVHPNFSNEPSFTNSAKASADLLSFVVDGRNRQFLETGFTFEKIKELFSRIQTCGYFEKDIKVVEVEEEQTQPPESATPQSTIDLDSKDDNNLIMETEVTGQTQQQSSVMPTAPLPTQVPNPSQLFNGGGNVQPGMMPPVMHAQIIPQQMQSMKTTVTAVENAFFNQMKYSQGPMNNNNTNSNNGNNATSNNELSHVQQQQQQQPNRYIEDFQSANISFLQDSLVEQIPTTGSQSPQQQKIPTNMLNQQQPKPTAIQQVHPSNQHHQQIAAVPQQMTHNFPPGLKLQGNASNIPVSYSQTQQAPISQHQPPQHLITKEASPQQHQETTQHYQNIVPVQQYQQQMPTNIQNLQDVEQKALNAHQPQTIVVDAASDKPTSETPDRKIHQPVVDKENHHRNNEWNPANNQQQPQIDTWNSETSGGNASQSSNYSRFNRTRGSSGGSKYNNYRNPQTSRNSYNNENGNGDSTNRDGGPTTFFRNNERYNNSTGGNPGRYNNTISERGSFSKRENYRTGGSGRFSSSMGSSNPVQRK